MTEVNPSRVTHMFHKALQAMLSADSTKHDLHCSHQTAGRLQSAPILHISLSPAGGLRSCVLQEVRLAGGVQGWQAMHLASPLHHQLPGLPQGVRGRLFGCTHVQLSTHPQIDGNVSASPCQGGPCDAKSARVSSCAIPYGNLPRADWQADSAWSGWRNTW